MEPSMIIAQLVSASLPILISLIAVGIALVRYRVHPTVSILAIVAFALHLTGITLSILFQSWLVQAAHSGADIQTPSVLFSAAQVVISATFLVLVTTAIFLGRSPRREPSRTAGQAGGPAVRTTEAGAGVS